MSRSNTGLTGACSVCRSLALASVAAQRAPRHPGGHATGISLGQRGGRPVPRPGAWQQGDTLPLVTTLRGLPTLEEVLGSDQTEWPGKGREYNGLSQYSTNLQNPRLQLCAFQKPKGNCESEQSYGKGSHVGGGKRFLFPSGLHKSTCSP